MTRADIPESTSPRPDSPFAPENALLGGTLRPSYTLASLLLVMTLIAVFLGMTVWIPAFGISLAILCLPAFVRTVMINTRRKARGRHMSFGDKVLLFATSLAVVVFIVAVSAAVYAAMAAILYLLYSLGLSGTAVDVGGMLLGICAGGVVGVLFICRLWWPRE